jgi:hypothetical protein
MMAISMVRGAIECRDWLVAGGLLAMEVLCVSC